MEKLRAGVKKNKQPMLSLKLRVKCGPELKTFLQRHGVQLDEEINPAQRAKLRTVFELFDQNEEGRIDARHLKPACEMLGVLEKDTPGAYTHKHLDFREFAQEMQRCGFGARDVLAELYDPETRRKLEERRKLHRSMPARDPELVLLREKRDRAVKNIFLEHLQRQKEIFGHINKDHEEEVMGLFRMSSTGDGKGSEQSKSPRQHSSPRGAVQHQGSPPHLHTSASHKQLHHQSSHAHHHSPRSHQRHKSHRGQHHEDSHRYIGAGKEVESFSVMVIEARNLTLPPANPHKYSSGRPPDTWITCQYGDTNHRTFPNKATLSPQWNSTLKFNVRDRSNGFDFLHGPSLIVTLMSSDPTDPTQVQKHV